MSGLRCPKYSFCNRSKCESLKRVGDELNGVLLRPERETRETLPDSGFGHSYMNLRQSNGPSRWL